MRSRPVNSHRQLYPREEGVHHSVAQPARQLGKSEPDAGCRLTCLGSQSEGDLINGTVAAAEYCWDIGPTCQLVRWRPPSVCRSHLSAHVLSSLSTHVTLFARCMQGTVFVVAVIVVVIRQRATVLRKTSF